MRNIIIGLLFLCRAGLYAQQEPKADSSDIPFITIKTNPLILLNPTKQAAGIATDLRVMRRGSMELEAGYFLNSTVFARYRGESYQGLRLRAGLKYFFAPTKSFAIHAGIAAKYNNVTHKSYRQVLRQGSQYIEILLTDRKVRSVTLGPRVGSQFYLGSRRRFLLETCAGLGIVYRDIALNLPPDAELPETVRLFSFEYATGKTRATDVFLSVHLGYAIW